MMGESEPGVRRAGGTSGGYKASCSSSSSRFRAKLSSDITSPLVNRFWKGDFGSSVEMPLKAIRGGDGSPSGALSSGEDEPMLFSME